MDIILKKKDVKEGNIITVNGEEMELVSPTGYETTFIEDEIEYNDPTKDTNPLIYGRRRWQVIIYEPTPFNSGPRKYSAHRYIPYLIGKYKTHTQWKTGTVTTVKKIKGDEKDFMMPESLLKDSFIPGAPMCSEKEMATFFKKRKILVQMSNSGEEIKEWSSVRVASKALNLHAVNIYGCLSGMRSTTGGFRWSYKYK